MTGQLNLKYIHESAEDDEDGPYWEYRYSGFHTLKGMLLRSGIAYLQGLQTSIKEKETAPEGSKQFFLDAGIKVVANAKDDATAVKGAKLAISDALQLLNGWTREETGRPDLLDAAFGFGGGDPISRLAAFRRAFPRGVESIRPEDLADTSYQVSKIMKLSECPLELERVDMRGLYHIMHMSDNDQLIYSEAAQMMGSVVEKIVPQVSTVKSAETRYKEDLEKERESEEDDEEGMEEDDEEVEHMSPEEELVEMAADFSKFMKDCKEGMYIQG